ncbi:MAG: bifunctional ADP-dependent NAD(P)H-hydrate dehydratase/NAD(P)H-hydrate epimerase [Collimonas sp.]
MTLPLPFSTNALYSVADIRHVEQEALATLTTGSLMRAAGQAAAVFARSLIPSGSAEILVLAGPGNNGGDALEIAYLFAAAGDRVSVVIAEGIQAYSAEAKESLLKAQSSQVRFFGLDYLQKNSGKQWPLIIDGLFGIGLTRPIKGKVAQLIEHVNQYAAQSGIPVVALDVPSGLNADTGQVVGTDGIAIRASHTITFIANKPGLHTAAGKDYAGQVKVADLAIASQLFPEPVAILSNAATILASSSPRPHNSHKGSYGDVFVIGGEEGMAGAPILAARAALHGGAGRVFAGFLSRPPSFDSRNPELMCRRAQDVHFTDTTIVIGPGLGHSELAKNVLMSSLTQAASLVIDADALNLIASDPALQKLVNQRAHINDQTGNPVRTLMTPHPLEAARLLETTSGTIQADRLRSARTLADKFNATIVLKGSGSIIATTGEALIINTSGNPALATAGTGDVLAGLCGALLAQGMPVSEAASIAVWLHGKAADQWVARGRGPIGMTASELIPAIRDCINHYSRRPER